MPWNIIEKFDFAEFSVSKQAEEQLNFLYDKPVIKIDSRSNITTSNLQFFNILVFT